MGLVGEAPHVLHGIAGGLDHAPQVILGSISDLLFPAFQFASAEPFHHVSGGGQGPLDAAQNQHDDDGSDPKDAQGTELYPLDGLTGLLSGLLAAFGDQLALDLGEVGQQAAHTIHKPLSAFRLHGGDDIRHDSGAVLQGLLGGNFRASRLFQPVAGQIGQCLQFGMQLRGIHQHPFQRCMVGFECLPSHLEGLQEIIRTGEQKAALSGFLIHHTPVHAGQKQPRFQGLVIAFKGLVEPVEISSHAVENRLAATRLQAGLQFSLIDRVAAGAVAFFNQGVDHFQKPAPGQLLHLFQTGHLGGVVPDQPLGLSQGALKQSVGPLIRPQKRCFSDDQKAAPAGLHVQQHVEQLLAAMNRLPGMVHPALGVEQGLKGVVDDDATNQNHQ